MTSIMFPQQNTSDSEEDQSFTRKIGHLKLPMLETKSPKAKISKERWGWGLPEPFLQSFEVIEVIGNGFQAKVYKVRSIESNEILAAKVYVTDDDEKRHQIEMETTIISSLSHPNIVAFHSLLTYPDFQTYVLLTEYFESTALSSFYWQNFIPSSELLHLLLDSFLSISKYLRSLSIIHSDLNLSNVLINIESKQIKLVDFGLAFYSKGDVNTNLYRPIGNPSFRPPKFKEIDVFSGDRWGILLILLAVSIGKEINSKKALKILKGKELPKMIKELMGLNKEFEGVIEEFRKKEHDE